MAMEYFCCYHSYLKKCEKLSDQELGRLFRALLTFSATGEAQELTGRESIAFDFIADDILSDKLKFERNKGENHWNWKGGITPKNQKERNSKKYSKWRKNVFIRDRYICQKCGQQGGNLNAHHIKPWSKYPDLRFSIDNGITLCKNCHKLIHKERSK